MPKNVKETVDLPDFVKESVFKIQILCTFQARMLLRHTWRETPCTPRRRFARLTCKFARTRRCYHTKKPVPTCVNTGLTCMLCGAPNLHALTCMLCGARTCAPCTRMLCGAWTPYAYAKRSTPSLETRAKNSGSSSGTLSPKTRASRKMRSPSSRRLSSPVRSVAIT